MQRMNHSVKTLKYLFFCFFTATAFYSIGQKSQLDTLYAKGSLAFYKLIGENLGVADQSKIGVAIVQWTVVEGEMENFIHINSLGPTTEKEIERVLFLSEKWWKTYDQPVDFILPVKFLTNRTDFFVDPYPEKFLKEIIAVRYNNIEFGSDEKLITRFNKLIMKEKFEKALKVMDEMIMRNPLNKQLREKRIYCYSKLNMAEAIVRERAFINEYITQQ